MEKLKFFLSKEQQGLQNVMLVSGRRKQKNRYIGFERYFSSSQSVKLESSVYLGNISVPPESFHKETIFCLHSLG